MHVRLVSFSFVCGEFWLFVWFALRIQVSRVNGLVSQFFLHPFQLLTQIPKGEGRVFRHVDKLWMNDWQETVKTRNWNQVVKIGDWILKCPTINYPSGKPTQTAQTTMWTNGIQTCGCMRSQYTREDEEKNQKCTNESLSTVREFTCYISQSGAFCLANDDTLTLSKHTYTVLRSIAVHFVFFFCAFFYRTELA